MFSAWDTVWPVNSESSSLILNSELEENHFSDLSDIISKTNTSIFSLEYNLNKAFMLKYNLGLAFCLHLSRLLPPTAVSALRHQMRLSPPFYRSSAPSPTHHYFCLELFPLQFHYWHSISFLWLPPIHFIHSRF